MSGLLAAVAAGDTRAFEELYDLYSPALYGLLLRICGNAEEANDALQDTFVHAWRNASRHDPARGSEIAWLITIARSRAIDRIRARRTRTEREDEAGREISSATSRVVKEEVSASAELQEARTLIVEALGELPREQRQVIELAYFEGKSHSKIAQELGEPLGSVKTRIQLGMKKLRAKLLPIYQWTTKSTKT